MNDENDYRQMMSPYDHADEASEVQRPLAKSPEELGYPKDYNPYQAQKKRIQNAAKAIAKAQQLIGELGATYHQFEDEGRSGVCGLLYNMCEEVKQAFVSFYVKKM